MKTLVHVDNEQIESVLKQCSICFVGMADTDGKPYMIPMNFGYKDGSLYLHFDLEPESACLYFFLSDNRTGLSECGSGLQLPDAGQQCYLLGKCCL